MKNRLIVDIYWCALCATWCCKIFTIIHAQNIVVRKIFVRAEGGCGLLDPPLVHSERPVSRRADGRHYGIILQINQSIIFSANRVTQHKLNKKQNNIKRSDGLPEKQMLS